MLTHNVGFFPGYKIDAELEESDDIFKIILIPNGFVTASKVNKKIKVWQFVDGRYECKNEFTYPGKFLLNDITLLNPDEIAACGADEAVWILNLREAEKRGPFFKMDNESILAITALSNTKIIFSCCSGLYLGDLASGDKYFLRKLNDIIRELIFLEKFDLIACSGEDCIYICNLSYEVIATFKLNASVSIMRDDPINSRLFAVDKLGNIYIWNLYVLDCDCIFLPSGDPRITSIAPVSEEAFFTTNQEGTVSYWIHENETWHSHKRDKLPSPILGGEYLGFKHNCYVSRIARKELPKEKFYIVLNGQNKQKVLLVMYHKNGTVVSRPLTDFLSLINNEPDKLFCSNVIDFPDILNDPTQLIPMAEIISPFFDTVNVRAAIYAPTQCLLIAGLHDGRITSWTLNLEWLALQLTRSPSYCWSSSSSESSSSESYCWSSSSSESSSSESLPLGADKSDGHDSDPSFQMQ